MKTKETTKTQHGIPPSGLYHKLARAVYDFLADIHDGDGGVEGRIKRVRACGNTEVGDIPMTLALGDVLDKEAALKAAQDAENPRFVWNIGAISEEYTDMPEQRADGETVLWDRQENRPVVTVHGVYGQAICLETTETPMDAPFSLLADWLNIISNKALASENIPPTSPKAMAKLAARNDKSKQPAERDDVDPVLFRIEDPHRQETRKEPPTFYPLLDSDNPKDKHVGWAGYVRCMDGKRGVSVWVRTTEFVERAMSLAAVLIPNHKEAR